MLDRNNYLSIGCLNTLELILVWNLVHRRQGRTINRFFYYLNLENHIRYLKTFF